jgi:hypothetical protein
MRLPGRRVVVVRAVLLLARMTLSMRASVRSGYVAAAVWLFMVVWMVVVCCTVGLPIIAGIGFVRIVRYCVAISLPSAFSRWWMRWMCLSS